MCAWLFKLFWFLKLKIPRAWKSPSTEGKKNPKEQTTGHPTWKVLEKRLGKPRPCLVFSVHLSCRGVEGWLRLPVESLMDNSIGF